MSNDINAYMRIAEVNLIIKRLREMSNEYPKELKEAIRNGRGFDIDKSLDEIEFFLSEEAYDYLSNHSDYKNLEKKYNELKFKYDELDSRYEKIRKIMS